jgi:hypothetical protein
LKESRLGAAHPDTALTMHYYASMLASLGREGEAWDMAFRAMAAFEAALDPQHPHRAEAEQLWRRLNP